MSPLRLSPSPHTPLPPALFLCAVPSVALLPKMLAGQKKDAGPRHPKTSIYKKRVGVRAPLASGSEGPSRVCVRVCVRALTSDSKHPSEKPGAAGQPFLALFVWLQYKGPSKHSVASV